MADRLKGWCPVDDRVFDAKGDSCPECGTALIAFAPAERLPTVSLVADVEDEVVPLAEAASALAPPPPAQHLPVRTTTIAAITVAIVVVSFFAGFALPRGRRAAAPSAAPSGVRADFSVGGARTGAGVRLQLERFSQRGRRIVLRVSVPDQPGVDIGRISQVIIRPLTSGAGPLAVEIPAKVTLPVRTTLSGFIVDGIALARADTRVIGIEIVSMTMNQDANVGFPIDLAGVLPVPVGGTPRANVVHTPAQPAPPRRFRLDSLVGWPDQVEARLEIAGNRQGWTYKERYELLGGFAPIEGRVVSDPATTSVRQVMFGPIVAESPAQLAVLVYEVAIEGNWRWDLPSSR